MAVLSKKFLVGMISLGVLMLGYAVVPQVAVPLPGIGATETRDAFNSGASLSASVPTAIPISTAISTAAATVAPVPTTTPDVRAKALPSAAKTSQNAEMATPSVTRSARATATPIAPPKNTIRPGPSPSNTATSPATSTPSLAALVPATRAFAHTYVIREDYDKVKDQTTFSLEERLQDLAAVPNSLYVKYTVPGIQRAIPDAVEVSFFSKSESWQFLLTKNVNLRLDRVVYLSWGVTDRGAANAGSVIELLTADVRIRDFLNVVNSRSVELQMGSYYFELTPEQMEALRDLASRMAP